MKLKKILSLALALTLIMSSQIVFANDFEDYDVLEDLSLETENESDVNDVVEISSAEQLFNIRNIENWNTKNYKLIDDIDLNDLKDLSENQKIDGLHDLVEGETWIPAQETFCGNFDGNGHVIKNLIQKNFDDKSTPNIGYAGLFLAIGSTNELTYIHDLTLENVEIIYDENINNCSNYAVAGGLCGRIVGNVNINNCKINSENISASVVGGLVGIVNTRGYINVTNCDINNTEVIVKGIGQQRQNDAGGLIGRIQLISKYEETNIKNNNINDLVIGFGKYNSMRTPSAIQIGGYIGRFFNQNKLKITDVRLNKINIAGKISDLDNAISKMYIGGAFGYLYGQDASNIEINNLSIKVTNDASNEISVYAGGFAGKMLWDDLEIIDKVKKFYQTCDSKIENCIITISDSFNKSDAILTGFLGEVAEYNNAEMPIESDVYNAIAKDVYYDFSDKISERVVSADKNIDLIQPTGVIPVTYAIVPKTAASDKAEDASAADDILNTKTSAAFTVKAYAVEKNDDGSVKYDATGEPVVGNEIEGFMDKFGSAVSVTDWRVAAGESIGDGEDAVKCDDAVTADNTSIKADSDGLGATLTSSANAGTKEAPANIIIAAKVNGVEKKLAVPYYYVRSHSSSGGGGGGSAATPTTETTTKTNADGSTTVTVKNNTTGTITETTTAKDGTKTVVETKKDGTVTTTVTKPNGTSLKTVKAADGSITISTGSKNAVKTEIPAVGAGAGTVAVRVKADGSEEIIKNSIVNDGKIIFMANDGDVIKIRNNGASFKDVAAGSWMSDAVAYVSGRELFKGVSDDEFGPSGSMTRGMLATVLYRYAGGTAAAAANGFSDIASGAYYADAVNWAAANGIVTGYSDGTFAPDKSVTREQLATILYRYAGSPQEAAALDSFKDAGSVSDYAANAVAWAVKAGIISGNGDSATLDPQGTATRAQVATMIKRFAEYQMAQ